MILLDYHSLLIALSFCSAGLALTFFVSWFVAQSDRVLMTWAAGAACLVVSILAYANFVDHFSVVSGIVSFSALLTGVVFFFGAAHQFRTGILPKQRMALVAVVSSATTAAPMLLGYDGVSYVAFNLIAMAMLFGTGWEYWRWRDEARLLITTLSSLYAIAGASFGLCAFVLVWQQSWVMNHAPDNWAETANLVICLTGMAAIGALSLGLNQVRLTQRHKREAETDSLTGLLNRRALFDRAFDMRASSTIVVIGLDIDHFKQINDIHGHSLGDVVLQCFADILTETVREGDFAARLGGEEFAVLLPDASLRTALLVAERIRKKYADRRFVSNGELFSSSVSVGISKLGNRGMLDELMVQADAALYVAKRSGRNRVVLFSHRDDDESGVVSPGAVAAHLAQTETTLYKAVAETTQNLSPRRVPQTRRV
ncbi:MAG: GGDEF domain-containing protein [Hyphomicrobium sp.]